MKFRLLATLIVVLAGVGAARAQATFPHETDNAALRYWFALAEVREPPDDDATRHLFGETIAGRVAWDEKKLGPILDSNLDALRTMQRATKLPICHWGFDYRNGARTPVWFLMRAGLLSHLNELQGIREMAQGDSRTAGKPESDDKIHAYEEYMLAAQAALREPPAEAKSRIADLESKLRRLGKVEQNLIPGLRVTNEARIRLATAHQELMQALSA